MNISGLKNAELKANLAHREVRLTRTDLVAYAQASGDHNPIHQDEDFAKSVGLPDVIAHGMFTMGLVGSLIEEIAGSPQNVVEYGTRFASPVVVPAGDGGVVVAIDVILASRDEENATATLDAQVSVAGTKVLSRTRAVLHVD